MLFVRALIVFFACISVGYADFEVRLLGGDSLKGQLESLDDKIVTIQTETGPVSSPLAQVLSIDINPVQDIPKDAKYDIVKLFDNSVFYCSQVKFQGKEIELTLISGLTLRAPIDSLVSWLREGHNEGLRTQWEKYLKEQVGVDRVLVLRSGALNPLKGVLGDVAPGGDKIQFRLENGQIAPIPLSRLHGLIFHRTSGPSEAPICMVIDKLGNTLAATKVQKAGDEFLVSTFSGNQIKVAESFLSKLDYNRGKLIYLSDTAPTKLIEKSGANVFASTLRKDVSLDGQPLKNGSQTYSKGQALHAYTELEYNLEGKFKGFKAEIGIDPRVQVKSGALVTIRCDGVNVYSQKVQAGEPQNLSLNIRDVETMQIIVSSASSEDNFLNLHDQSVLGNARVTQ